MGCIRRSSYRTGHDGSDVLDYVTNPKHSVLMKFVLLLSEGSLCAFVELQRAGTVLSIRHRGFPRYMGSKKFSESDYAAIETRRSGFRGR